MKKRSVKLSGHATSITLEDAFWGALKAEAERESLSINALLTKIDNSRSADNLSSAVRLYILDALQRRLTE